MPLDGAKDDHFNCFHSSRQLGLKMEVSISSILLESPHQVGMKNVFKSSKNFLGYFNTLETQFVKAQKIQQKAKQSL